MNTRIILVEKIYHHLCSTNGKVNLNPRDFLVILHIPIIIRLRRRVYTNTQELWNYVQSEVITIRKTLNPAVDSKGAKQIEQMLETAAEHKRSLLNDLNEMREVATFYKK